ncbi:MAG TPA: DNA primase [Candidatus Paceibacterota bacterium]|nr:DNA primase [Candidatus Paceibacterota bacterium]
MSDTVEKVKAKLSIVDVVAPYVKLQKAGRYMRGLSPFTKEKTPSFFVNVERNSYYCFSTSQGGDIFTFIEKMEGVDFKGALKILAEKAGVEVVYERGSRQDTGKLDRLRDAMARAEQLFIKNLAPGTKAYEYALKRGLTPETIQAWGLGYAPDAWRTLLEELTAHGFSTKELEAAGLIKEADEKRGTYYDRFRNRLMFPIRDSAGRTVAFTGRSLDPNDQAKYLNSPETELFKKSEILFGMDRAKDAIRTRGFAVLVEGQFDLILLHQIGFANTIALSGTALSTQHIALIKRYADNLMLALDADRAGLAASARSAHAALASGMRVKAVRLPQGKDPADIANEDAKEFTRLVKDAESIVEFFLSVLAAIETDSHKLVLAVEKTILPLVAAIPSAMEREYFVGVIARSLGLTPEAIKAGLPKSAPAEPVSAQKPVPESSTPMTPRDQRAALLHAVIVTYPDLAIAKRLTEEYNRITGAALPEVLPTERALFEAGLAFGESPTEHAADDLIRAFEHQVLNEQLKDATMRLRLAEAARNTQEIEELTTVCKKLSARLAIL